MGVLAVIVACGSSGAARSAPTTIPTRPLSSDQAAQLASTLYRNYQAGGAHIDAQVPYSATESVGLSGDVDFAAQGSGSNGSGSSAIAFIC